MYDNENNTPGGNHASENPPANSGRSMDSGGSNRHDEPKSDINDDPFRNSSMIRRSPQSAAKAQVKATSITAIPPKSDFEILGKELESLVEMLEDGKRRSVHQPMRDAIMKAKKLYDRIGVQKEGEESKKASMNNNSSQTSPLLKTSVDSKRKQQNEEGTPKAKRPQTGERSNAFKDKGHLKQAEESKAKESARNQEKRSDLEPGWKKVSRKKERKKIDKKEKKEFKGRPRPDAIIIKATGEMTYAEMIRKMQGDPKLEALGNAVSKIRRTQKGELLIQLKNSEHSTSLFKEGLGTSLGDNAEVKSLTPSKTIECKDIDEITSPEDVVTAIKSQFEIDNISLTDISLRKAYGGTQTASIKTTEATARKLLDKGELKLGWSICHFKEKTTLTKCFRCLEFGHMARNCKSDTDRSKMCRKCGEVGHIAKLCTKNACCMFCVKDHPDKAKHVAGSNSCPVFRRALSKKK